MDFARLEGCLVRDALPEDLSWTQHVRLQRLLAAAGRLNERGVEVLGCRLDDERHELGSAFRLLWTLRRTAREAYPEVHRDGWYRDYLEQVFLFAHLTLKWEEQTPTTLTASAAMAGVAAEALRLGHGYRCWSEHDLRGDGAAIDEP